MGMGSKIFADGFVGIRGSGVTLISAPLFQDPWILAIYWMLIQSIYSLLEILASILQGITTYVVLQLSLQEAMPPFFWASCFRMMGKLVRPVSSMDMGPLPYFFFCEAIFFIWGNTVWKTTMVHKAFCKSPDISFGQSIVYREGKSVSSVAIYSSKKKTLQWPW